MTQSWWDQDLTYDNAPDFPDEPISAQPDPCTHGPGVSNGYSYSTLSNEVEVYCGYCKRAVVIGPSWAERFIKAVGLDLEAANSLREKVMQGSSVPLYYFIVESGLTYVHDRPVRPGDMVLVPPTKYRQAKNERVSTLGRGSYDGPCRAVLELIKLH